MHSKRGSVTISKVNALKTDLNLLRIKWNEMNLSYTPKFHVLYEHSADLLLEMNGFYDMGEDAIERWHQIRLRHETRIRCLRSLNKQKENQAKYEYATTNPTINKIIEEVKNKSKRKWGSNHVNKKAATSDRKKSARISTCERIKSEIELELRTIMKTTRELLKDDYKNAHAM